MKFYGIENKCYALTISNEDTQVGLSWLGFLQVILSLKDDMDLGYVKAQGLWQNRILAGNAMPLLRQLCHV